MNSRTDWTTRAETSADIPAIREINLAAFDTAEEADLVDALRQDPAWIDGLSLVTLDGAGALVGYVLLTRAHIGDTPALCLGPCAVLPQYQKTGVGSAAIRAALDAAKARGENFVTVLGHPEYYPRFGFTRASLHGVAMKTSVPDDALMALSLVEEPLPSGIIRYAAAFGDI
ncbi:acetyltransferase [Prescottella equi]|uniref:GNAT family N-acetyltransferase n=1 Tax=Rhodococcus hoagii TaxID=43767 RepID=UPI0009BCB101|nr:N-acetyltransferase [Prescottella equi]MBM4726904.1 GNAT family N-acetyltransferase [Prescottella equi]NKS81113.1 GNAT family N-acetyltransferase [Prescottella equi]OQQ23538.1 acetyltransferase [Prescottella equi]OQQ23688.1 acetyltransferase [Prescottella equi]